MIHTIWPMGVIDILPDRLRIYNRTYDRVMYWRSDEERERWQAWLTRLLLDRGYWRSGEYHHA